MAAEKQIHSAIPTIDLAKDSPERQAELIRHALGSVGFFAVVNAGPGEEDVKAMFDHSRTFFDLPMNEKEDYLAGPSGSGYTKLLSQALGEGRRDHKETFSYGKYCSTTDQPMPRPFNEDSSKNECIKRFYNSCHEVSERLMELFALALELPQEHFRQSHSFGLNTAMSLIHYPSLDADAQANLSTVDIRAGEHKDWGTMTLLFQEPFGEPGLEVYLPKKAIYNSTSDSDSDEWEWVSAPVPQEPGGFLVNVGLGMELWSGGMYKATLHRVIFPTSKPAPKEANENENDGLKDRYTLAFFVQPDDNVAFQPILPGGKIDNSFKAITSGELFDSKLKESMNRFPASQSPAGAITA